MTVGGAATPQPPYVAVVFTAARTAFDEEGYGTTASRMEELAASQPGYLGIESARGSDGVGITVSYWADDAAAHAWGRHAEHLVAQQHGRERWYEWFRLRFCRVERAWAGDRATAVASRFAVALDGEDYTTAAELLSPDCRYHIGGRELTGVEAIIASYSENGDKAAERFDEIRYESEVQSTGSDSATVTFRDHLRFGERRHTFTCRQHIRIGEDGRIVEIRHEELPGERDALRGWIG